MRDKVEGEYIFGINAKSYRTSSLFTITYYFPKIPRLAKSEKAKSEE